MTQNQRQLLKVKKSLKELFEAITSLFLPPIQPMENDESYSLADCKTLIRLNPVVRNLVTRCADLFFFYQESDPFARLQEHDYGFYQYEPFLNYLNHGKYSNLSEGAVQSSQPALCELADLMDEHPYLKPIFR